MNHKRFVSFRAACILGLASVLLGACRENYSPKPRAYFRIALPEQAYQPLAEETPFAFEYPLYAQWVPDTRPLAEPFWGDLSFPSFRGTVHLSYKQIASHEDLLTYMEDSRGFVQRHIPKATGIREEVMIWPDREVYGILYEIHGKEAASPLQFFVTDSVRHFLRGALYFDVTPNNDSLAPVIRRLEKDIRHMLHTLTWEEHAAAGSR
jgi:gliding motility-associated lipoprotein GldD